MSKNWPRRKKTWTDSDEENLLDAIYRWEGDDSHSSRKNTEELIELIPYDLQFAVASLVFHLIKISPEELDSREKLYAYLKENR